jgi:hypothetical protein|tara:strand:+ start:1161 stop:1358 length:198 start_codon:yes stop_codon:yes gene_type:complete
MNYSLRYLDKFSARAGKRNWISDPKVYTDGDVFVRLDELQSLGYLVEMTFILNNVEEKVDLDPVI